jgi:hypothetical protein
LLFLCGAVLADGKSSFILLLLSLRISLESLCG